MNALALFSICLDYTKTSDPSEDLGHTRESGTLNEEKKSSLSQSPPEDNKRDISLADRGKFSIQN